MKKMIMRYPGDPAIRMNRAEFLEHFPRTPMTITDMRVEEFPMEPDQIYCNADPGDEIYVLGTGSKAICFNQSWKPYCK